MEDVLKEVFPKNLKIVMTDLGISNGDASKAMDGVATQTVTAYRSGHKTPPVRYIVMFAEKYGVSLDWLLRGVGDMYLPTEEERQIERSETEQIKRDLADLHDKVMQLAARKG